MAGRANPLRGEASFRVGATTYTLVIDVNAFCTIEEDTGLGVNALIREVQGNPSFRILRSIVHGMLENKHPEITKIAAGNIMSDAGMELVSGAVKKAIQQAMPAKKKGEAADAEADPQKGTGGTG